MPAGRPSLLVAASSTAPIRSVRFFDGRRGIATVRRGIAGLYSTPWRVSRARKGRHVLRAILLDRRGRTFSALRSVRVCR
jgi:hypothetical protein